ncbi:MULTISPECIES: S41 family peptidase [Chitinophagaceae]
MIPLVLNATSTKEVNTIFENWIDALGAVRPCNKCSSIPKDSIKLGADYGDLFDQNNLPSSLRNKLDWIRVNYAQPSSQYYYMERPQNIFGEWKSFTHERIYEHDSIDVNKNLLTLFRFWNAIQYFYPYRHLTGSPWNEILKKFIPIFLEIDSKESYVLASERLIASINDSHAYLDMAMAQLPWSYSNKRSKSLPLQVKFVENKLVVIGYYCDSLNLSKKVQIGDIIETIRGVSIDSLVRKLLPYTSASNYDTKLFRLQDPIGTLLTGDEDSLPILIKKNNTYSSLENIPLFPNSYNSDLHRGGTRKISIYTRELLLSILTDSIGYVNAGSGLSIDTIPVVTSLQKTKGLIIDLRHYPGDSYSVILYTILQNGIASFAKFYYPTLRSPGTIVYGKTDSCNRDDKYQYSNKIVVLVNAETQSAGEFNTMLLQSRKNVTVLGSTTAGADGPATTLPLTYGFDVRFTGYGVQYPDGTECQRKGIKIDVTVRPSIKGIREGRDELLEKAIEVIKETKK